MQQKAWNILREQGQYQAYQSYQPLTYDYNFGRKNSSWPNQRTEIVLKDEYALEVDLRGDQSLPLGIRVPGGPGSALTSDYADYFSKNRYSMVRSDWRGIGTSLPAGPGPNNTTQHCLSDLKTLQEKAGQNEWTMMGSSWGTSMALQFLAHYPQNVNGLVLGLPFLGTQDDMWWGFSSQGLNNYQETYLPDRKTQENFNSCFEKLYHLADIKDYTQYNKVLNFYATALSSNKNPTLQKEAFITWASYELASSGEFMTDEEKENIDFSNPKYFRHLSRSQIMADYFANSCYLDKEQGGLHGLKTEDMADKPIIILAHKHDPLAHPETLEKIHKLAPSSEIIVSDANWHWIYDDKNDPYGRTNDFVRQGYAYGTTKLSLLREGKDTIINPGIHQHKVEQKSYEPKFI